MSSEIFKKNDIRSLLASSKSDTAAKLLTLNSNITDMFQQVDAALIFYLDSEGYVCQRIINNDDDEEEEENNNE